MLQEVQPEFRDLMVHQGLPGFPSGWPGWLTFGLTCAMLLWHLRLMVAKFRFIMIYNNYDYMPYWEGWWEPHRTAQQQIYDSASNHLQPHEPVDAIKANRRNKKGMKKMGGNISAGEKWPELLPSSQSQCSLSLLAVVSEARPANTNLYQERFRFPHVLVNLAAFTFQGRAFLGKGSLISVLDSLRDLKGHRVARMAVWESPLASLVPPRNSQRARPWGH